MSDVARWYIVHTYSGYEKIVAENIKKVVENKNLQQFVQDTKIPTEKSKQIKDGKLREYERKLFPSYVMVKMILNDETWLLIKGIKGITGFVGNPYSPSFLTQKEVDELGIEISDVEVDYSVGDVVTINSGAFKGFSGEIKSIDKEACKVEVEVLFLGRKTPIEVGLQEVILSKE